jgi:HK97 family phage portal protein
MFPEITSAVKGFLTRSSGPTIQTLGLEEKGMSSFFDQAQAEWYARNGYPRTAASWGSGAASWSGESVNINTALNHSVIWGCVQLISGIYALLPSAMYRDTSKGHVFERQHPMDRAMRMSPNVEMTASTFKQTLTAHYLMGGGGFAKINRRSGTGVAIGMDPLLPIQVYVAREKNTVARRLVYEVKVDNSPTKTYTVVAGKPQDIFHVKGLSPDGLRGYFVTELARHSIGNALATERNVGRFWALGGRVPYNLKLVQEMKGPDKEKFRADWEETYSNPHRTPIIPPWIEYQKTGLSATDMQMGESRLFAAPDLCRWFGVSPHLIGDLSKATFSNVENLAIQFVNFTLQPHINRWEQEMWRCILTDDEKNQGLYWKHDIKALTKGDFKTRMDGYATALNNAIQTSNEVRAELGYNPLPGGDDLRFPMNMQTYEQMQGDPALSANDADNISEAEGGDS